MIKVKLTWPFNWPIIKQTPKREGIWKNCHFIINEEVEECDFWIVFDGLQTEEKTYCARKNTILVTAEPPSVKSYCSEFVKQFNQIITCHTQMRHPNLIHTQQGLNWMVGGKFIKETNSWEAKHTKDYDELSGMEHFKKEKLLSVIVSNKRFTPGHELRYQFLMALKRYFGNEVDIFGVGFQDIPDKWDAIYPYRYHLVIENSVTENYWTEKLADAFLGGAYPIYYGCPNIYKYFSQTSLSVIDIKDQTDAIRKINFVLSNIHYHRVRDDLFEARNLVLNKYNFFNNITNVIENSSVQTKKEKVHFYPEYKFQNRISFFYMKYKMNKIITN